MRECPSLTTRRRGTNAVLITFLAVLGVRCASAQPAAGTWTSTNPLIQKRFAAGDAVLSSGRILVVGGNDNVFLTSVEIFDPASSIWVNTMPLPLGHGASAILLNTGEILGVGDDAYNSPPTPPA